MVFKEGKQHVTGETILSCIGGELPILESGKPAAGCTDPEAAILPCIEGINIIVLDLLGVGLIKDSETHAVRTDKSFFSAEPEITIMGLGNCQDGVLR